MSPQLQNCHSKLPFKLDVILLKEVAENIWDKNCLSWEMLSSIRTVIPQTAFMARRIYSMQIIQRSQHASVGWRCFLEIRILDRHIFVWTLQNLYLALLDQISDICMSFHTYLHVYIVDLMTTIDRHSYSSKQFL